MFSGLGVARLLRADPPWGGFPNGYALSIGGGAIVLLSQFVTTMLIREPPDEEPTTEAPLAKYLHELWTILRGDVDFRRYVGVAWFATFCQAGVGFYMSYAIRELGAPTGHSGIFMSIMTATGAVAGLMWGYVSRRRGNLMLVRFGTLLLAIGATWAAASPNLRAFYPALVWTAFGSWGFELGGYSLQLDFGRGRRVARTVAVAQTALLLPRMCGPILAGLAADTLGFRVMFAIATVCAVAAFLATLRIRDPRERDTHRPAGRGAATV
jgi:MFS family permease